MSPIPVHCHLLLATASPPNPHISRFQKPYKYIPGRRDTAIPNFYILEGAQMLPISVPQDYTHTFIAW